MLKIKIDFRENELINNIQNYININIKFKDIIYETFNLPLGDIIIELNNKEEIIFERKTLNDLASSIKDGRYEEQSFRLNGTNIDNHNIIYLIEGDFNKFNSFKNRIDKQTLYSAIFSLNYFKGFSIMRTQNVEETAFYILNCSYKILKELNEKGKIGFYNNINQKELYNNNNNIINFQNINLDLSLCENKEIENKELENKEIENKELENKEIENITQNNKEYVNVIKKVKKENINENNIGEIMLCTIPSISSSTAISLMKEFNNLPNLIQKLKENKDCLDNIYTLDSKNKPRKLSKNVKINLIKFLKINL